MALFAACLVLIFSLAVSANRGGYAEKGQISQVFEHTFSDSGNYISPITNPFYSQTNTWIVSLWNNLVFMLRAACSEVDQSSTFFSHTFGRLSFCTTTLINAP